METLDLSRRGVLLNDEQLGPYPLEKLKRVERLYRFFHWGISGQLSEEESGRGQEETETGEARRAGRQKIWFMLQLMEKYTTKTQDAVI